MPATYIDRPGIFKRQAREASEKRDKEWRVEAAVCCESRAVSRVGVHRRGVCLPPVCVASCCLTSAGATARVGCLGRTPWPIGAAGWL